MNQGAQVVPVHEQDQKRPIALPKPVQPLVTIILLEVFENGRTELAPESLDNPIGETYLLQARAKTIETDHGSWTQAEEIGKTYEYEGGLSRKILELHYVRLP